jgi:hypothetical protein
LPQGVDNPTNVRRFDGADATHVKIFPGATAHGNAAGQSLESSQAYMKKASNPANMEPAISVDQSPVSNPRRRPPVATRTRMAPSYYLPVLASDGQYSRPQVIWLLRASNS